MTTTVSEYLAGNANIPMNHWIFFKSQPVNKVKTYLAGEKEGQHFVTLQTRSGYFKAADVTPETELSIRPWNPATY